MMGFFAMVARGVVYLAVIVFGLVVVLTWAIPMLMDMVMHPMQAGLIFGSALQSGINCILGWIQQNILAVAALGFFIWFGFFRGGGHH